MTVVPKVHSLELLCGWHGLKKMTIFRTPNIIWPLINVFFIFLLNVPEKFHSAPIISYNGFSLLMII